MRETSGSTSDDAPVFGSLSSAFFLTSLLTNRGGAISRYIQLGPLRYVANTSGLKNRCDLKP